MELLRQADARVEKKRLKELRMEQDGERGRGKGKKGRKEKETAEDSVDVEEGQRVFTVSGEVVRVLSEERGRMAREDRARARRAGSDIV